MISLHYSLARQYFHIITMFSRLLENSSTVFGGHAFMGVSRVTP
jgi:hypothetical protein